MPKTKPTDFLDNLSKSDLVKLCLEQEGELEKLRPKPAKFKLGQVLAFLTTKHSWMSGQPCMHFSVLSLENRNGKWYYGYSRMGLNNFNVYPEDKCRALNELEINGQDAPETPVPMEATSEAQPTTMPGGNGNIEYVGGALQAGLAEAPAHWDDPQHNILEEF